jgi:Kef-type K+ transport system membrane component KefB
LETVIGWITLGVLVLQDLAVILFLAVQPDLKYPSASGMLLALGKVLLLVGVAYGASRFVLPRVFKTVARQPELVLVVALGWCFTMAGFADQLRLSGEMGALIAGVMVSTFPYIRIECCGESMRIRRKRRRYAPYSSPLPHFSSRQRRTVLMRSCAGQGFCRK